MVLKKMKLKHLNGIKKSADQKYRYAQNKLGSFYKNGIGTKKNIERAVYWYKEALDNGCQDAKENLDLL